MLPADWTERPATADDLADVATLVIATDVAEFGAPDWSEEDQADDWANPKLDLGKDTLLVHDGAGRLVGYAYVWPRSPGTDFDSDTLVHPDVTEPGVEEHLLAFTERRAREQVDPAATRARIVAVTHAPNTARAARFRAAGFTPMRQFFRMTADISAEPVDPATPPGVTVRPAGVDDVPALHAVLTEAFRDHFRSVPQTLEEWSARHPRREADVAPWLLAEADGVVAGALVSNASVPGLGWVQAVGVLPSARSRGVGLALLTRAFADFAAAGRRTVSLGVDAENGTGALRLYEKAGMHVERAFDFYEKSLV